MIKRNRLKADNPKLGESLLKQALDLWIRPEIERRRKNNKLPNQFTLRAAQIVMNVDAGAPQVRFNEEVKAVLKVRLPKPMGRTMEAGETVVLDDGMEVEDIELTDADPNAGHVTLLAKGGQWHIKFDFRYNAERCLETLAIGREFLDGAAASLKKQNLSAFVDNLFSATELMAKAELLLIPDKKILDRSSHGLVSTKYNSLGKLGNTDQRYVKLLNRLASLRKPARYGPRNRLNLKPDEPKTMLRTAKQMMKRVSSYVPRRVKSAPT
jgi:uncharacterized protein (UPF0332 family)